MKKIIMISLVFLSLLLQGCDSKEEKIKQEQIKQEEIKLEKLEKEGIKQDIVFIFQDINFSEGYMNNGYYITNTGNKVEFDVSEESQDYESEDKLYEYLIENSNSSNGEALMDDEDLYKCYEYLYDIDPDVEIEEIRNLDTFDMGEYILYGVQLSEDGKATIVLINGVGDYNYINPDKQAKKIVDIFDENDY